MCISQHPTEVIYRIMKKLFFHFAGNIFMRSRKSFTK